MFFFFAPFAANCFNPVKNILCMKITISSLVHQARILLIFAILFIILCRQNLRKTCKCQHTAPAQNLRKRLGIIERTGRGSEILHTTGENQFLTLYSSFCELGDTCPRLSALRKRLCKKNRFSEYKNTFLYIYLLACVNFLYDQCVKKRVL